MKYFFYFVLLFLVATLASCSELRKSEEAIKHNILNDVPLGSDMSEVLDFLKDNNREIISVDRNGGFYDQRVRPAKETGKMSIQSNFGDYRKIIFRANVTVYFAFDEEGKLIDVWVWKTTDAP